MAKDSADTNSDASTETTVEISFVAAVFDDVQTAKKAYGALKELSREGMFKIVAASYMEKTERGKIKVHEYKDWRGGKGALVGGGVGAVVGIIGSTILLPVAVGALIGGTLSKVHDTRFSDKGLGKLAESLPAGSSALVAIVEDEYVEEVEKELTDQGGKKVHSGEVPNSVVSSVEAS